MKTWVNRMVVSLLLVTCASVAAFAKSKRATVHFSTDIKVNGTLVKSGTYDVVFDEQTGALSIEKGHKIVATTATRLEQRDRKARATEVNSLREGNDSELLSITFGGSDQRVVVNQMGMQAGGNQ